MRRNSLHSPFPESWFPLFRRRLIGRNYYACIRFGIPSDNHVQRPILHKSEQHAARVRAVIRIVRDGLASGDDRVYVISSNTALKHALNSVTAEDHSLTSQDCSSSSDSKNGEL